MISSLVIHIANDPEIAKRVIGQINENKRLQHGPPIGNRLPLVLDANSTSQAQSDIEWLRNLPGVEHVDVAFVQVEDCDSRDSQKNKQSNAAEAK